MEYSPIFHHNLHVVPSSSHVKKNKLFVFCIMMSLWVYMVYCCVGYCSTMPSLMMANSVDDNNNYEFDNNQDQDSSRRDLLLDNGSDLDTSSRGGEEDWEARTLGGDEEDMMSSFFNESESSSSNKKLLPRAMMPMPLALLGVKQLPRAIIIGVKKGGTRALLEFLRVHPDVRAVGAEPHFFDRSYDKGLEWYRDLMPKSQEGQVTMEKTPSYYVTKEVPGRIYTMSRDTKLIVVVRDPVTRAISDYTQTRSKKPDIPSFESLTFKNASAGLIDTAWSAVQIGMYAKHLERWLRYFPLEQLLFVSGERLISDPAGQMARVQDFLGIRRVVTDKHFHFNPAKGFPCLKRPEGGNSKPHCLGKTKGRTHPNIDPQVVQRLRDFYRPFNSKFYQMTGHDFGWD